MNTAANAILTFKDEQGREWLAAAQVGPIVRMETTDGKRGAVETITVDGLKERKLVLTHFTVIEKD
jgi:uncharacterized protein YkvS